MNLAVTVRGLALSGGASFGAYQVGVWRALSERGWRPDVTTGISIGAVNSWLFARDVSYPELLHVWLDWPAELLPGRERRFDLPWRTQIPMFRAWIERIVQEYGNRPVVRDGTLTLLEVSGRRVRTMSVAEAGATDLLAACALPGVMAPVRTDHGLCLDYGILRYIPLRETIAAGADEVFVIDLLAAHPFPSARRLRRALFAVRDRLSGRPAEASPESLGVDVTVIGHASPLGGVLESFRWTRPFAERLVADGYRDACDSLDGRRQRTTPAAAQTMSPSPVNAAPQ